MHTQTTHTHTHPYTRAQIVQLRAHIRDSLLPPTLTAQVEATKDTLKAFGDLRRNFAPFVEHYRASMLHLQDLSLSQEHRILVGCA